MGDELDQYLRARKVATVAAFVGIDSAGQAHDVALRSASDPEKIEHCVVKQQSEALIQWSRQLQRRFGGEGKILICLEQRLAFLINHLTGYECFELYPVNLIQLRRYRETFCIGRTKEKRPDADLLCELLYYHWDRLRTLFGDWG
jgi:Transposase